MVRYYNSALASLAMLIATLAIGYPTPVDFDGNLLRWNISPENPTVTYEVVAEDPGDEAFFETAIEDSVLMWNAVSDSYLQYSRADSGEFAQVTINISADTGDNYSSGFAIFDQSNEDGPIHCDITVGTNNTYEGFAKTILHELGHCFGLGHSLIPTAIMSYKLDQNSFDLDLDDTAAISRLYPADGSQAQLPMGCGVSSMQRSMDRTTSILCLLLPLILLIGRRSAMELRRLTTSCF